MAMNSSMVPPLVAGGNVVHLWWLKSARRERERQSAKAEQELDTSRQLLEEDRRDIVQPLRHADRSNHFSDLIRDALREGYARGGKGSA